MCYILGKDFTLILTQRNKGFFLLQIKCPSSQRACNFIHRWNKIQAQKDMKITSVGLNEPPKKIPFK